MSSVSWSYDESILQDYDDSDGSDYGSVYISVKPKSYILKLKN